MSNLCSKKELDDAVSALESCGGNKTEAAKKLGIPRTTLRERLEAAKANRSIETSGAATKGEMISDLALMLKQNPDVSKYQYLQASTLEQPERYLSLFGSWRAFKEAAMADAGVEPLSVRERQKYRDKIFALEKSLRDANRELNDREDARAALFNIVSHPVESPSWSLVDSAPSKESELPVLFASDWQYGEYIHKDSVEGFNEFTPEIANERIRLLVSKTIELSFTHRGNKKYPGIYYIRGGDMISGEIHADLRETNMLQSCPSARELVKAEKWVIQELRKAFKKVHVVSVPGNHGRTTEKPRSKAKAEDNFDILTHYWLESCFDRDHGVTFKAPPSGDALLNLFGYNVAVTHGDKTGTGGGRGFLGAAAPIVRGMKLVFDYYSALDVALDYCLMGHYHTPMMLEYGFSNGCLPGYSEYARSFRMRPSTPPAQWLLYLHPHYGVVDSKLIQLAHRPAMVSR